MLSGIVISVRLPQFLKARTPILVTLFGIVISVRLLHSSNACTPILVTLPGIVISVRLLQAIKAPFPMLVTGFPSISAGISKFPAASLSQFVIPTVSSLYTSYSNCVVPVPTRTVVVPVPTGTLSVSAVSSALADSTVPTLFSTFSTPESPTLPRQSIPAVIAATTFFHIFILNDLLNLL